MNAREFVKRITFPVEEYGPLPMGDEALLRDLLAARGLDGALLEEQVQDVLRERGVQKPN